MKNPAATSGVSNKEDLGSPLRSKLWGIKPVSIKARFSLINRSESQMRNTAFDPASQRLRAPTPIFFSLESEEALLPETFRYVGDDHFLYATDIPHWDTEFPENLHQIQRRQDLSEETKNKLLYQNAKALYAI